MISKKEFFKKSRSKKFNAMKQHLKHPGLFGLSALEKTLHIATPLAAVSTLGANPDYNPALKVLTGPYEVATGAYHAIKSYALNEGVRDSLNGAVGNVFEIVSNFGENIMDHPVETALTAVGTYALGRILENRTRLNKEFKIEQYTQNKNGVDTRE